MKKYNIAIQPTNNNINKAYQSGLLPQRNQLGLFYLDSSCRSCLNDLSLSSENKRVLKLTSQYKHILQTKSDFNFDYKVQKRCSQWSKTLSWQFPTKSIKTIFSNHIFNYFYTWSHQNTVIAYAVCYFGQIISHIGYVFYNPKYQKNNLVNTMVLTTIIDSQKQNLKYCYLGRFDPHQNIGYYKRNMPNFQVFDYKSQTWLTYQQYKQI